MPHKRSSPTRSSQIRVRPEPRKEPDLRRLGQAVIAFAMRSTDEDSATSTKPADGPERKSA